MSLPLADVNLSRGRKADGSDAKRDERTMVDVHGRVIGEWRGQMAPIFPSK